MTSIFTPWNERIPDDTHPVLYARAVDLAKDAELLELRAAIAQNKAESVNVELTDDDREAIADELRNTHGIAGDIEEIIVAVERALSRAQAAKPALTQEQLQKVLHVLVRYRNETPLGYQQHMITDAADEAIEIMKGLK